MYEKMDDINGAQGFKITGGIFLLQNYTAFDCAEYKESFEELALKSKYTKLDASVLSEDTEKNEDEKRTT